MLPAIRNAKAAQEGFMEGQPGQSALRHHITQLHEPPEAQPHVVTLSRL